MDISLGTGHGARISVEQGHLGRRPAPRGGYPEMAGTTSNIDDFTAEISRQIALGDGLQEQARAAVEAIGGEYPGSDLQRSTIGQGHDGRRRDRQHGPRVRAAAGKSHDPSMRAIGQDLAGHADGGGDAFSPGRDADIVAAHQQQTSARGEHLPCRRQIGLGGGATFTDAYHHLEKCPRQRRVAVVFDAGSGGGAGLLAPDQDSAATVGFDGTPTMPFTGRHGL